MGVHRTCGEPDEIKTNTHPKPITARYRGQAFRLIQEIELISRGYCDYVYLFGRGLGDQVIVGKMKPVVGCVITERGTCYLCRAYHEIS